MAVDGFAIRIAELYLYKYFFIWVSLYVHVYTCTCVHLWQRMWFQSGRVLRPAFWPLWVSLMLRLCCKSFSKGSSQEPHLTTLSLRLQETWLWPMVRTWMLIAGGPRSGNVCLRSCVAVFAGTTNSACITPTFSRVHIILDLHTCCNVWYSESVSFVSEWKVSSYCACTHNSLVYSW